MTTTRHTRLAGATIGLLALVGAVFGSAPAYADDEGDTPAEFSELSSDEIALLESDDPVTITIDPATGAFESVELTPVLIQPNSVYSICNTGHACWHGWLSPHIWYGFDGSGATGTCAMSPDSCARIASRTVLQLMLDKATRGANDSLPEFLYQFYLHMYGPPRSHATIRPCHAMVRP